MREAMRIAGYDELRREQAEKRERGELMGIVSFFTEVVGAGRAGTWTSSAGMADGADLRVHRDGKAVLSISAQTQGQAHETTFAQIVAEELGISRTRSRSATATPTARPSASAPTAAARPRCPAPPPPSPPACATRRG